MSTIEQMAALIGNAIDVEGFSQAEFCRRAGVSQKHLSQMLMGNAHAAAPTLDYWAFLLGRHFNVTLKRGVRP